MPIMSYGIILFRFCPNNFIMLDSSSTASKIEYLMIRRRNTLGYIDFMRGKYSITNRFYILNMIKQMTLEEKTLLKQKKFNELWELLWKDIYREETDSVGGGGGQGCSQGCISDQGQGCSSGQGCSEFSVPDSEENYRYNNQYKIEESNSRVKFHSLVKGVYTERGFYNLESLIDECEPSWEEPEWGFPKGRRNYKENEFDCAVREFKEETGYSMKHIHPVINLFPFEEIFLGSNYKSYKHKYFLMFLEKSDCLENTNRQCSEVSKMEWKTLEECLQCIRPYNIEKIELIQNVDCSIRKYMPVFH